MTKDQVKVKIQILNQNGDTSLEQPLEEAIVTIIKEYFQQGRFPFVNTEYFQFSAKAVTDGTALAQDTAKLRELLNQGDVVVRMTGALVGGN